MKHSSALLLSSLTLPALAAFALPETKVAFTVAPGTSLTKTVKSTVQLTLDDMNMTMNGQAPPFMPEMDMNISTVMEIVVEDEYLEVSDGAPKLLKRTYEKLKMNTDMSMEMDMMGTSQSQENAMKFSSELEGKTVQFKRAADEDSYTASFPEAGGDEELLEGLSEDMDLRAFLPKKAVSEGDEWNVPPARLVDVMAPGGDLKLLPEDFDLSDMMGMQGSVGSMSDWFTEQIKGEVKATFKGLRTVDEVKVGVIALSIDIKNAVDLTELVEKAMQQAELPPEARDMEFDHMDVEVRLRGEATLLWNLAGGHAHSFELSGDFGMNMNMGMSINAQGMDMKIEQTMEMSGTISQNMACK